MANFEVLNANVAAAVALLTELKADVDNAATVDQPAVDAAAQALADAVAANTVA